MSVVDVITLLMSSGVFSGGVGLARWAFRLEYRVMVLENKTGVTNDKTQNTAT